MAFNIDHIYASDSQSTWKDRFDRKNPEHVALWKQAAGELSGFANALRGRSGITASQLDMAIELANQYIKTAAFESRRGRLGGRVSSIRKAQSSKANGSKGGRPRKEQS